MIKAEMLEHIKNRIIAMEPMLKEAGVLKDYLYISPKAHRLHVDWIRDAYKWIMSIDALATAAKRIHNLLPQTTWDMYRLMGDFEDHREVILLKGALKELRRAIKTRNRPNFFKKGKVEFELANVSKTSKTD